MKLFDLQVNGAFGMDFSNPEMTADDFNRTVEKILARGCDKFLPTVITSSTAVYERNLRLINREIERHGLRDELPGFHLEGPFISALPGAVGTHNPDWVQAPSIEALEKLYNLAEGHVAMLTVAADQAGIAELIKRAHELKICVSLGHEMATSEQIAAAGADAMTHLGNGIPNLIDRHHNPIWAGLANDKITVMAICDGQHLPKDVLKCFIRCKGVDNFIAVSDAACIAGLPPGKYDWFGNKAVLEPNGRFHDPAKGCLIGSSFLLANCEKFLRETELLTEEEIRKVCWDNPNRLLASIK